MKRSLLHLIYPLCASLLLVTGCDNKPAPAQQSANAELDNRMRDESVRWGKTLAQTKCTICHDESAGKPGQETPYIGGQHKVYLLTTFDEYGSGNRKDDDKQRIMAGLSAEEKEAIASYYASLPDKWDGRNTVDQKRMKTFRDPELISKGQAVAQPCGSCHGMDGNSEKSGVPSLAALQPDYFVASLKSYLDDSRQGADVMKNFKLALTETNIKQLSAFFSNQLRRTSTIGTIDGNAKAGGEKARACFGCHGNDGNSFNPAFPSISGQNAAYMQKALLHYRAGERKNPLMRDAVGKLSDADIRDIAVYFAQQTPINPLEVIKAGEQGYDPVGEGKKLAAACNGCHGNNGISSQAGIPSLAGLSVEYLTRAIDAYRSSQRKNDTMLLQVKFLDPLDVEKIAFYYASRDGKAPAAMDKSDYLKAAVDSEEKKDAVAAPDNAGTCNGCHGADGNSSNPSVPSLAGQNATYIGAALRSYQNGERQHDDMGPAAKDLTAKQIQMLAAYYASLTLQVAAPRLPEAPEQLAAKCDRCHGEGGSISDAKTPRIAGQVYPYLLKVLTQYQSGNRDNSTMHKMTAILSQTELQAMAKHYAVK